MAARDFATPSSSIAGGDAEGTIVPAPSTGSATLDSLHAASSMLAGAAPFLGMPFVTPAVDMLKAIGGGGGGNLLPQSSHFVAATSAPLPFKTRELPEGYEVCIDCPGMSRVRPYTRWMTGCEHLTC